MADYWSDKSVFGRVGGLELASITYEVLADFTKPLASAFSLVLTTRVLGIDVGTTTVAPLANGPVTLALAVPGPGTSLGTLHGEIDDARLLDAKGNVLPGSAPDTSAAAFAFSLVGTATVTIPVAPIVALVPHLGWLVAAALSAAGGKITVHLGHDPVTLPIHRGPDGKPMPGPV
jgi:hypothetical protein